MVHNAGAQQVFGKYGHPYIFKKGVPSTTRQLSGFLKNWVPSVDFFMTITLNSQH